MTHPSQTPRIFRSKDSLALGFVVLVIVAFVVFSTSFPDEAEELFVSQQLFFGACVGVVCGIYVIYRLNTDPHFQTPMMKLTFYRVVAELGISVRFLFSPYINHELCGDYGGCGDFKNETDTTLGDDNLAGLKEVKCAPWSAMLQFFLIAAELWFLCTAFDFAVTLSNPFSPFKDRLPKYHIFCWGIALVTAVVVGSDDRLHGVWFAESDLASETICWIDVESGDITDLNWKLWFLFYIPLMVIYCYGIYVTCCAYSMLSHGIQVTFVHRARVLFYSQLQLVIYMSYWFFLLMLYVGIFASKKTSLWDWMLFFIPARGILGIFLLFCTQYTKLFSGDDKSDGDDKDLAVEEFFDLNTALQNEIVAYATVGIKESALLTYKDSFVNHEYADTPISHHQHHFWIKIPEELVQLENLKGIVNVMDREFKDFVKGIADTRSIASLKSLLYQEPRNVRFDEERSSDSMEDGIQTTRRSTSISARPMDSFSAKGIGKLGSKPSSTGRNKPDAVGQPSTGLTLQQLLPDDCRTRPSITSPHALPSSGSHFDDLKYFLRDMAASSYTFLKRNSILLNSAPSMVHFTEYSPAIFYEVRTLYGIEGIYAESFEKPIKLHLAEGGASNALFFFSECRKFIAKSCTAEEMLKVRSRAGDLRDHFQAHRDSLITRIFGAYKLQVYSSDLYFIVTNNVLLTDSTEMITEKFDLKGSSVHRHMKLPRNGETVRCRLCGNAFVYNSKNHFRRGRDLSTEVGIEEEGEQDSDGIVTTTTGGGDESTVSGASIKIETTTSTGENEPAVSGASSSTTSSTVSCSDTLPELVRSPPSPYKKKSLSRRLSNRKMSTSSTVGVNNNLKGQGEGEAGEQDRDRKLSMGNFGNTCPLFRHVPDAVMKDNDFRGKAKIRLPASVGDELVEQLYVDCTFLAEVYEVMDYSLLVGVYKKVIEIEAEDAGTTVGGVGATGGAENRVMRRRTSTQPHGGLNSRWQAGEFVVDYSYYMGIIDYQQDYGWRKKLETWYKVNIGRSLRKEISCIPPGEYKDRFLNFMEDLIY